MAACTLGHIARIIVRASFSGPASCANALGRDADLGFGRYHPAKTTVPNKSCINICPAAHCAPALSNGPSIYEAVFCRQAYASNCALATKTSDLSQFENACLWLCSKHDRTIVGLQLTLNSTTAVSYEEKFGQVQLFWLWTHAT